METLRQIKLAADRATLHRATLHLLAKKEDSQITALEKAKRLMLAYWALLDEPSSQKAIRDGKNALAEVFGEYPCSSEEVLATLLAEASFFVKLNAEIKNQGKK